MSRPAPTRVPKDTPSPIPEGNKETGNGWLRGFRPRLTATWVILPVAGLLVALIGILAPAIWRTPTESVRLEAQSKESATCASPYSVAGGPGESAQEEKPVHQAGEKKGTTAQPRAPTAYRSMWPFSPTGKQKSCEYLAQLQKETSREQPSNRCSLYAPWIAYLSLETSSTPACELEAVFGAATEAITRRSLCGQGYAFLSAYYSYKRVLDRSRSFLEQALQISPEDPWVRLVEGMVYDRDFRDIEKADTVLTDLIRGEPSFSLARYHLAKIYIANEKYGKAHKLFLGLSKDFPQQQGFERIQRSLASIEDVPYYSSEKAQGLLQVSRAFSDLMDYPLAVSLFRKVLDEMPGTLPNEERKSAFYDLGRISEITGDRETAFTCYQKALRIDPFYRDARKRIGDIIKGDPKTS